MTEQKKQRCDKCNSDNVIKMRFPTSRLILS